LHSIGKEDDPSPEIFMYLEKIELKNNISTLRRLKDWQRNVIGDDDSALLNIYRKIDITAEKVINKLVKKRRKFYL